MSLGVCFKKISPY